MKVASAMNYSESLAFLDSYVNYEKLPSYRWTQAAFRLDRMERLLELAGDPHNSYPCAHVAGTKGKGSTCAFLASILHSHGKKTGLYLSPHVMDVRERVSVDGRWISEEEFALAMTELRAIIEQVEKEMIPVTYFEILTALAMVHFARQDVETCVFEVGIGGRLDATNILTPVVCVITTIGFDHTDKLGDTLSAIAGEKCGIVKPGVPVVSAAQPPEALAAIERICAERGASLRIVGRDIRICAAAGQPGALRFETDRSVYEVEKLGIEGVHQRENAACAIGAAEELHAAGVIHLEGAMLSSGLGGAHLRARFEVIPGRPYLLLDGAHNADSLRSLVESLKVRPDLAGRRIVALAGLAADKDLQTCLSILDEAADEFIFTRTSNPRAAEPAHLLEILTGLCAKPGRAIEDVCDAYEAAWAAAGTEGLVIVTGSFYLAGDVASILARGGI